jgi:TctA family transporter
MFCRCFSWHLYRRFAGCWSVGRGCHVAAVSFYLTSGTALVRLAGFYYGAEHGGSIASIRLNIPGTPSASVKCLDGYPMARDGRAGVALFLTAIASFVGAIFGLMVMVLLSPVLAEFALLFGPAEYFAFMALGLVAASVVSTSGAIRGVMIVCLGILLGTVGVDINSSETRFVAGLPELRDWALLNMCVHGFSARCYAVLCNREYSHEKISTHSS